MQWEFFCDINDNVVVAAYRGSQQLTLTMKMTTPNRLSKRQPQLTTYIYCNFSLDNSNLPLTRNDDCSSGLFYKILPSITRTIEKARDKSRRKKNVYWSPSLNFIRLLQVVITPSVTRCWEEKRTLNSRMKFRLLMSETLNLFQSNCVNSLSSFLSLQLKFRLRFFTKIQIRIFNPKTDISFLY